MSSLNPPMPGSRESDAHRRRLLADARGRVLDVGAHAAANLALYPVATEHVVVLEPDGRRRERLLKRVPKATMPVEVHEAPIEHAPFPDDSFDTVVSTHALRVVADPDAALGEMRRVLKPDGRLLFLEAAAPRRPDPLALIRSAGFVVTACERFSERGLVPVLKTELAAGVAQLKRSVAA